MSYEKKACLKDCTGEQCPFFSPRNCLLMQIEEAKAIQGPAAQITIPLIVAEELLDMYDANEKARLDMQDVLTTLSGKLSRSLSREEKL